jgi:N-acetylmuramoyl-L-alanine amidase
MKRFLGVAVLTDILLIGSMMATSLPVKAESSLSVVYPPPKHETSAEKIFFIGTASPNEPVLINGKEVKNRSASGHFAPSLPLKIGENIFVIRQENKKIKIKVTRLNNQPEIPKTLTFAPGSLIPAVDLARLPDEPICLSAVAPANAKVSAQIGQSKILLMPQIESVELPANSAVLTSKTEFQDRQNLGQYQGCTTLDVADNYGKPIFTLEQNNQTVTNRSQGQISILSLKDIRVIEVIADVGVARTGASSDYSRLTPLPKGVRAKVTGKEGEWLRLDYGGWIRAEETKPIPENIPPQSIIRGITSRQVKSATEIVFPLQVPVPIEIEQKEDTITLSLHNTTAQTDTIRLDPDPLIKRLDWQQVSPTQVDYTFELNYQQQWGYDVRYEGTNLILSLRHSPRILPLATAGSMEYVEDLIEGNVIELEDQKPLENIKILLDPGHGGKEQGSKGATGYPEKQANLIIAKLVRDELKELGATVYLTREKDEDLSLEARVAMIDKIKPDLAISIHYNALPDDGDAENTQGISTFWYNTQAHAPAMFLHNYLIEKLNRPNAGTFWNNLALTRPHTAPAILLELGFMINPEEFEWIADEQEQEKLAETLAQGIKEWFIAVESSQIKQDFLSDRFY